MFKSKSSSVKEDSASAKSKSVEPGPSEASSTTVVATNNDQGKIMGMLNILRKLIGVKDLINLRLSLPTQLLDPISNLEFWGYMDQPEYFLKIPDSDDPVERMISVIRWWIIKDFKYSDGKLTKPFNSVLGEQFFCKWEVTEHDMKEFSPQDANLFSGSNSDKSSISDSKKKSKSSSKSSSKYPSESKSASPSEPAGDDSKVLYNVEYITEQVSHHPPVSAFVYRCPEKKLTASGLDHIAAKFSGFSATVKSGSWTKGIFVKLGTRDDEEYLATHSEAQVVGWLTGSLKLVVTGTSRFSCPKTGIAAVVDFTEKNWYGKLADVMDGKIFKYDPATDDISTWTSKTVPEKNEIIATISGQWNGESFLYTSKKAKPVLLVDMKSARIAKRFIKPDDEQSPIESRRVWGDVARLMIKKDFSAATKLKIEIEDNQRKIAEERKEKDEPFVPKLFVNSFDDGNPKLLENAPINI
ncbi:Oxysterol-binding protein-like protein 1 [Smittium mucronatum]|uniref:Oxysterol-binding protein-like protein 1 n=1 Tax=Smittium mucronatum TaxID=133383 RepID=A0A1R0GLN7_9FUNG|nr:Oxysterol-binding protein-like protein 1 [Smittium mucronatum]